MKTDHSQLLDRFAFATCKSRANAEQAIECVRNGERGAFLVIGDQGVGKTHLVREILRIIDPEPTIHRGAARQITERALRSVAQQGYGFLDNFWGRLDSQALAAFLTAPEWTFRELRSTKPTTVSLRKCVVFVTAAAAIRISSDLRERFKVIELVKRPTSPRAEPMGVQPGLPPKTDAYLRLNAFLQALRGELIDAIQKHAPMHSPHEGIAVIREEVDELWEHVKRDTGRSERAIKEAMQIAAMGVRYAVDLSAPGSEDDIPF